MSATIGAARIELSINSAKFEAQMKRAEAAVGKFKSGLKQTERRFKSTGRKMQSIGSTLQRRVSLPILAIGGASIKAASDFESAFTGVTKTVDATEKEYGQLRSQILQMSKEIPASAASIANVTEIAGQLGVRGVKNLMRFTRTAIDMGNATNVSAGDAATAMARIDKIMGGTQTTFDRLGSSVVEIGNNFATTEDRIFDAAQRLAGVGKTANITQAQIIGIAGAITSTSDRVEAGSTAISKTISTITSAAITGGKKLNKIAAIAGMTASQFQKAFKEDAAGAITTFIEGLGRIQKSGGDVYSVLKGLGLAGQRVAQNILALAGAGDTLRSAIDSSSKAWRSNTALTTEAEKRYKDFNQRLQVNINKINAVGIALGRKLMPYFTKLVNFVVSLAQGFGRLNPEMQNAIIIFGALGVGIPGLLTALGFLASSVIPALITGFGVLASATGPILGAVAVIGTIVAIVGGFTSKTHKATKAQNDFIAAVKKGNKTLAEASRSISNLSTQEEFYATRSLLGQKEQEFARIKKLYKNLDDLSSETLIKEGGRSHIKEQYEALKKEIVQLKDRKEKLRELNDAENHLHEAQKMYADWSDRNKARMLEPYQQRVDTLRKELGLYHKVEKKAKKAGKAMADAHSGAGGNLKFTSKISFNTDLNPFGKLHSNFNDLYSDLMKKFEVIKSKATLKDVFPDFNGYQARIDAIKDTLTAMVEQGVDPSNEAIQQLLDRMNDFKAVDTTGFDKMMAKTNDARSTLQIALGGIGNDTQSFFQKFTGSFKKVGQDFKTFMTEQIGGAFTELSSNIGESLAGVENEFQTAFEKIIILVADFAVQLGKILISIGTAMAFTGILSGPGGAYIAAGSALVAVGSGVKAGIQKRAQNREQRQQNKVKVPAAANGGVFTGPTLTMVGDNANAKIDPEIVSPISALEGMMNSGGGGMSKEDMQQAMYSALSRVRWKQKGSDLVAVIERTTKKTLR